MKSVRVHLPVAGTLVSCFPDVGLIRSAGFEEMLDELRRVGFAEVLGKVCTALRRGWEGAWRFASGVVASGTETFDSAGASCLLLPWTWALTTVVTFPTTIELAVGVMLAFVVRLPRTVDCLELVGFVDRLTGALVFLFVDEFSLSLSGRTLSSWRRFLLRGSLSEESSLSSSCWLLVNGCYHGSLYEKY